MEAGIGARGRRVQDNLISCPGGGRLLRSVFTQGNGASRVSRHRPVLPSFWRESPRAGGDGRRTSAAPCP